MTEDGGAFHILHVCTGNIGRSPMAERIMRHHLAACLGNRADAFRVDSAGTWGHSGSGLEADAGAVLDSMGVDASGFSARELVVDHVADADLVLTATAEHRSTVVGLLPAAIGRTFTLREFARLAVVVAPRLAGLSDPSDRARASVPAALRARGAAPWVADRADDDVADPIGAPRAFYAARAAEIDSACARTVALFAGGGRLQ